ncbi:sigma-70 family RNA polymerase sigma factor [Brachyspira hampsonii]|uniref:R polymerase sigma factor RpoD n=1 Tax=Brachyspira hampsonii TaxID=1287055 RepID=A0AAC9XJX8_9SPIR|nr:sigma-70 family RNA polymerase sigma factor [Brachyspira hampsonii]ASJ20683.1 R polymerase sigma factor RpoD [Brachyspira hampsonii]ELV06941.1 R polymerase sigma factor RpoD [Brachyspira hampsonii 30599]MBW5381551.1 RNA polymerase sigma factor RpoD/SigA [Brachyspira hampsonii]OEJ18140.1 R polymerase sigma factor RpoD [Brachyspira hampsonii]
MLKKDINQEYKGPVSVYLKQIGEIRRLTKEEELDLWQRLEVCRDNRAALENNDDAESLKKIEEIDKEIDSIQHKLVKSNLRLVISIAKRYYNSGVPFIDIIDEGNIGLIEAVKRFEYKKGFKFSTYGVWWIKQSIVKEISSKRHIIRFPMHIARLIKKSIQTSKILTQKLGREPTIDEIAKEMKIDRKTLSYIMIFTQDTASVDSFFRNSDNNDMTSIIEDKNFPSPHQKAFMDSLRDTLTEALKCLDEKERTVIISRYGLYGKEAKTLEDTGKELNITRERVRQIQIKAIKKLAGLNLSKELKSFLWD